jgi:hypothetical protein
MLSVILFFDRKSEVSTYAEHWSLQPRGTLAALSSSWDAVCDDGMSDFYKPVEANGLGI